MKKRMSLRMHLVMRILFTMCFLMLLGCISVNAQSDFNMRKKILFVVTSHDQKGNTGEPTGYYLSEVAHPWNELVNAGYEIDFVSPKGGKAPVTGFNLEDSINKKFWEDPAYRYKRENTMQPSEVNTDNYVAIHYAGGLGSMWDFADNTMLALIAAKIYEKGGIVSAVCHGPAGLINVRLSNGKYLIDGKRINAYSNEEEEHIKMEKVVPFLLEPTLIERGAIFEKSGIAQVHVVTDQRVVTGQNPESAKAVGAAVIEQLKHLEAVAILTRYEIKQRHQKKFQKALRKYVNRSVAKTGNIMAEAYYEQDNTNIWWTIERWSSREALDKMQEHSTFKQVKRLLKKKGVQPAKTVVIKDLEPVSKDDWRRTPDETDKPVTIMLFVDSKPGTENNFKEVYHTAMPQFRSEPGVINYQLSQLEENSTQFVTYEKFRNEDAFQYHLTFPPIQPVIDYLNTSIKQQPFQTGLHRLVAPAPGKHK
jgi:putative intracellular protease/amidase/quinol monooxygenase YgiN